MLHQTTLDESLHRAAVAQRRAELRAMHRLERAGKRRQERACCRGSRPAACCA